MPLVTTIHKHPLNLCLLIQCEGVRQKAWICPGIQQIYSEDRYLAVFAGLAPVSNPRFVIAVMVDEPSTGKYYGGQVAAPIFAKVMAGALRVYGVEPDKEDTMPVLLTKAK